MTQRRNPRTMALSLLLLFGLVAVACGGPTEVVAESAESGDASAVEADLFGGDFIGLNGEAVDFAAFEGQPTVLWFWAPW